MRLAPRDVRDLIVSQKNDHGPSYWRYGALQRWSCLKYYFREIFGVVRFSTFATKSATNGLSHCLVKRRCHIGEPEGYEFLRPKVSKICVRSLSRDLARSHNYLEGPAIGEN